MKQILPKMKFNKKGSIISFLSDHVGTIIIITFFLIIGLIVLGLAGPAFAGTLNKVRAMIGV